MTRPEKKYRRIYHYVCSGPCQKKRWTFSFKWRREGICHKCKDVARQTEGMTSLFDTVHAPVKTDN